MRRSRHSLVLAAGGCVAIAAAVWFVAFRTDAGERLDVRVLTHVMSTHDSPSHRFADLVGHFADPLPFALFAAGLVCLSLARGGPRLACAVAGVLLAANVTTEMLKRITAEPRGIALVPDSLLSPASWPSGHTTAAASLALCLVAVAPPPLRWLAAAVGGVFALAVGISVIVVGAHFPSDVLGAFCVAAAWTLVALAAVAASPARRTASASPSR